MAVAFLFHDDFDNEALISFAISGFTLLGTNIELLLEGAVLYLLGR